MDEEIPREVKLFINQHLTGDEIYQILEQLRRTCIPNNQVLWTGMPPMGPLMDTNNALCPKKQKSPKQWSTYVHGASAIFAWLISEAESVTVLSRPPPVRFHPSEGTSFQTIEQPIIKGTTGNKGVNAIRIVHPRVPDAADFTYQLWPKDGVAAWVSTFGIVTCTDRWRDIGSPQIIGVCDKSRVFSHNQEASSKSSKMNRGGAQSALSNNEKGIEEHELRERHAQERCQMEAKATEAKNALRRKQSKDRQDLCEQHKRRRQELKKNDKKRTEAREKEVREQKQLARKHRKEKSKLRVCERADIVSLAKRQNRELEALRKGKRVDRKTLEERQRARVLPLKRENMQERAGRWDDALQSPLPNTQASTHPPESEIECLSFMSRLERRFWSFIESLVYLTRS
ncbi:hypothetical protein HRG_000420 [Hirsutella rhossiliensis]|uniref:Uncharacterized protein n=1 Tax=Hirsutella rhossiliensis TaxID=111463 RepID=A0A9P8N3P7_9HYPO|nr:uncharacterized protein HRG_00420 [Hirsutella rhossiliensis]KAH0967778.1 hypothetical protein HRG_00420 [Hirsutella rhossiliensis]